MQDTDVSMRQAFKCGKCVYTSNRPEDPPCLKCHITIAKGGETIGSNWTSALCFQVPGNEDNHYQGEIQPIDFIEAQGLDFLEGNVIKYISRYKRKGGLEDLKKAAWYLDRLIKRESE